MDNNLDTANAGSDQAPPTALAAGDPVRDMENWASTYKEKGPVSGAPAPISAVPSGQVVLAHTHAMQEQRAGALDTVKNMLSAIGGSAPGRAVGYGIDSAQDSIGNVIGMFTGKAPPESISHPYLDKLKEKGWDGLTNPERAGAITEALWHSPAGKVFGVGGASFQGAATTLGLNAVNAGVNAATGIPEEYMQLGETLLPVLHPMLKGKGNVESNESTTPGDTAPPKIEGSENENPENSMSVSEKERGAATPGVEAPPEKNEPLFTTSDGKPLSDLPHEEIRKSLMSTFDPSKPMPDIMPAMQKLSVEDQWQQAVKTFSPYLKDITENGGVRGDQAQVDLARQLGMQPDELMQTDLGRLLPHELLALGAYSCIQSAHTMKLAQIALADKTPENIRASDEAIDNLLAYSNRFQNEASVKGQGLRATGMGTDEIQKILQNSDPNRSREEIRKAIADAGTPDKVGPIASSFLKWANPDVQRFAAVNAFLSYATVQKKLVSDMGLSLMEGLARTYGAFLGKSKSIPPGEGVSYILGNLMAVPEALRAWGKGQLAGKSLASEEGYFTDRLATDDSGASPTNPTDSAWRYLRALAPSSVLSGADDFGRIFHQGGALRALAARQAWNEDLEGADFNKRVQELVNNPPDDLVNQASNQSRFVTFHDPLQGVARALTQAADRFSIPIGDKFSVNIGRTVVLPFANIPFNIAKLAYRYSPLPGLPTFGLSNRDFIPLFPSKAFRDVLSAGGATRDEAIGRVAVGTMLTLSALPYVIQNAITGRGPSDPGENKAWRLAGNEPYSIKMNGKWYSYRGEEPLGITLGAISDTVETMKYAAAKDSDALASSLVFGIADGVTDMQSLTGISDFLDALKNPQKDGKHYIDGLLSHFAMPQGAAQITKGIDPWVRAHYDLQQDIEARTPGKSSSMPPLRDFYGRPIPQSEKYFPPPFALLGLNMLPEGVKRVMSPFSVSPADNAEPFSKWVWDNREFAPHADDARMNVEDRPKRVWVAGKTSYALSPQQFDRYQELAGQGVQVAGQNMQTYLNNLVQGKNPDTDAQGEWDDANPAMRFYLARTHINQFRKLAREELEREDPTVNEGINTAKKLQAQRLGQSDDMQ